MKRSFAALPADASPSATASSPDGATTGAPPVARNGANARRRIVVGVNESAAMSEGWHARTRDGRCGLWMRPSLPTAFVLLPLPVAWGGKADALAIEMLVCGAPSLLGQPVEVRLSLVATDDEEQDSAQGTPLARWQLTSDVWVTRRLAIEPHVWSEHAIGATNGARSLRVRLETSPEFVPDSVLNNGDHRPFGVQLAALTYRLDASATLPPSRT